MGPLFQLIGTYFLYLFYGDIVLKYSFAILSFNLLPIFPLDGAKLLNLILNKIISFKTSHLLTVYISFLVIFVLIIKVKLNFLFLLIIIFISIKVLEEYKNHHNLFNLFLLERYNHHLYFKKKKVIKNIDKMQRDYTHLMHQNGKYYTEREILRQRFDN